MDKLEYTWNSKKLKKKQHMISSDGKTFCRVENGGAKLDVVALKAHPSKPICKLCLHFQKNPKPPERHDGKKKNKKEVDFYKSWDWKKLRYETLKKYGAMCMLCGSDYRIVVDHIKPRSRFPELELDPDNMQVLCNECNMGKGNKDYTDFRPREPKLAVLMGEIIDLEV